MNVFHNKLKPVKWPKEIHLTKDFNTTTFPESQHKGITTKTYSDLEKQNTSLMLDFSPPAFTLFPWNHNSAIKVQNSNGTEGLQQFLPQLLAAVGHWAQISSCIATVSKQKEASSNNEALLQVNRNLLLQQGLHRDSHLTYPNTELGDN